MATPIRYYITCDDDRPVVRSIPVSVRETEPVANCAQPASVAEPAAPATASAERRRVPRLVRSAMGRRMARR
jgi:hypothetical protein